MLTFFASDEDLDRLDDFITDVKLGEARIAYALETGFFPSQLMVEDAKEKIREQLKKNKNRYMKIPDSFYENAKYILDINVTGEQVDVGVKGQMLQLGMQMIQSGALMNKGARKMFTHLMGLGGMTMAEFGLNDADFEMQQPAQPQGSMAAPSAPAASPFPTSTQL